MESRSTTQPTAPEKADCHLPEPIQGFLLSRRVGNCTEQTLGTYREDLYRFARSVGASLLCSMLVLQNYLTSLHARLKPITVHQHFRVRSMSRGYSTLWLGGGMMLPTRLCELLDIEVPILGASMGPEIAGLDLAAAVSNAGGLGMISVRWRSAVCVTGANQEAPHDDFETVRRERSSGRSTSAAS